MGLLTVTLLGAVAGFTILIGLPVARLRVLSRGAQGFLNALATGVLLFLLWDILSKASQPVEAALGQARVGSANSFVRLAAIFAGGVAIGLLSLVYLNGRLIAWLGAFSKPVRGPGADVVAGSGPVPSSQMLALMIATGLGLHNFSEGLAIGQSAVQGAIGFTGVLVIGFGLHNITEGFGIAAPMASSANRPSWRFLALAGVIGGAPTFVGTLVGYRSASVYLFVLFLALAAGALIYVINETLSVGRRLATQSALGWGLLIGFLAGYSTDLFLTFAGG